MGRVQDHNREVIWSAEARAAEMQDFPSPLEERMKRYLDTYRIDYEFQKIFYIRKDDGWIATYYIADFFIPDRNIIIEVDGKFHSKQKQKDKNRTKEIQEYYPEVRVLRYTWDDLSDIDKMTRLMKKLK